MLKKTLLAAATAALLLTPAQAEDQLVPNNVKKATSPMPEIMSVVVRHSDELRLSPKQVAKLRMWRDDNKVRFATLAWKIRFGEKAVNEAALTGADAEAIQKKAGDVLANRKDIVVLKTQCRDMVRATLTDDQWTKTVKLVRDDRIGAGRSAAIN